jgi:tetratricopeptide (TPR) repeat protein
MRFVPCIALALLAAPLAAAPKSASRPGEGKKYLDAAIKLYSAFEFERALAQLDKARAHSESPEMDVSIALYEGIVQLELGHDEQAEAAFKTALSLNENAVLPTRVSPKVQALFDNLKATMSEAEEKVQPQPRPEPQPAPEPPPSAPRPAVKQPYSSGPPKLWWAPAAAGALLAGAGVVLLLEAKGQADALLGHTATEPDPMSALSYRSQGPVFQALGFTGIALGAACVVVSALLFFVGERLGL